MILVMSDDQGWGDVGYSGHKILKTPNLDAMAGAGLRFNLFYSSSPVCSPSKSSNSSPVPQQRLHQPCFEL